MFEVLVVAVIAAAVMEGLLVLTGAVQQFSIPLPKRLRLQRMVTISAADAQKF